MKFTGIRAKLNVIGGLFTLVLIVLVGVAILMNSGQKKDAYVVNMAGLQRMLTQKMSKEILYLHFKNSNDFRELNSALNLFEYNLNNLILGNESKKIEPSSHSLIVAKLHEVQNQWKNFKSEILKVRSGVESTNSDVLILLSKTEKLLYLSQSIVSSMVKENLSAQFIDLSGRLRMLSQRIGLFSKEYIKHGEKTSLVSLKDAKNLFTQTIVSFLENETLRHHEHIHKQISETYEYWQEYESFLTKLMKNENSINHSINLIFQTNTELLATMDEAVSLYTQESENRSQDYLNIIYFLSFLAILVTIYAYLLVKDIILHVDGFVDKAKMLANENTDTFDRSRFLDEDDKEDELNIASSHIADYIEKVNRAMNDSNTTIKQAENVADELQKIAIDMGKALQNLNIDEREKTNFNKKVSEAEDIAIESTENLIHVSKILSKLQITLSQMIEKSKKDALHIETSTNS